MKDIHNKLKKYFRWYDKWHNHPRHKHAHWFGVFSFLLLTASFISAQLVFLYSEKLEAQAQTALPAPNHQMTLGYYYAVGQYGNFLNEVSSYNNSQVIVAGSWIRGGAECDTAALNSAFSSTIAAGQRIIYIPIGPEAVTCNSGTSTYDTAMNVARNYWNNIDILYIADEPTWDQATTEANITNFENAVAGSGLSSKPIMINYTPDMIMNGTGFQASNLDIVSFEAYAESARQNEPNLAANLLNEINQAKARIGNRQMMLVIQGYGRNYCPPTQTTILCWSNLDSLKSIQSTAYLAAHNDARVIGLTIFSYGRLSGTKDLADNRGGQCIKTEHQRIWGAMTGAVQPAPVSCGGTPSATGTEPTGTIYKDLGPGSFPDPIFYQGRIWVAVQQNGLKLYNFAPDLTDQKVQTIPSAGMGQMFQRLTVSDNILWLAFRNGDMSQGVAESVKLWRSDTQAIEDLGGVIGNDPVALGNGYIAWTKWDGAAGRFYRRLLTGGPETFIRDGIVTGIARILPDGSVVAIDEDRFSVPWGVNAWFAGNLTVAADVTPQDDNGVVGRLNDDPATEFNLWLNQRTHTPHAAYDGINSYVIATWNPTVRLAVFRLVSDVGGGPPVDATPGWEGGLAYNPVANNWLVVSGPRDDKIYGRIMSDAGPAVGNFFQINVNVNPNGAQVLGPKVAYDTDLNRYLVIWVDFSHPTDTRGQIFGQFISPTGALIGSNFEIPRDFSGGVFLGSNSPMRYDSVNKKFVFAWETRDPNIHTKLRTINSDGTANPTINVTTEEGPGVYQVAPVVDINPSGDEYCVVYGYRSLNDPFSTEQRSNAAIRRVDATTGALGPVTTIGQEAWGGPAVTYNSTEDNYLITFDNNGNRKGAIFSSCDASTMGPVFTIGQFGATVSDYNSRTNTFAVIGQSAGYEDLFVILDSTGNVLGSKLIFPEDPGCTGACGNFAPSVAANYINGTYAATSAHKYATTRFISPLGLGITGGTAPIPTPAPCDPGIVQPGIPVICDFSPTIARPGDTINIAGGNLSSTVQMFSLGGARHTVLGTADTTGENVSFVIPTDIPEGDYTLRVIGSDGVTFASSNKILTVTLNLPTGVGPTGEDTPFGPTADITPPGSTITFEELISSSLSYAVYAVGVAVFIMILYAGFLWITSAANPGNIAMAKRYITNAVIGAVLLLSSYIILYTINPDLVGGSLTLEKLSGGGGTSGVSIIIQPTCNNGVCSNNTGNICTQDTNCNVVCVNNICNNTAIGTCTLDTDCQLIPQFIADTESKAATAFSAGCSRVKGVGYQDFTAVECPGSVPLAIDTILELTDSGANQKIGATIIQTGGNNGAGRKIVVLDTGYDYSHPELSSSYGGGRDFINIDDDPMDDHTGGIGSPGHGSHVAGIITADGINGQAKGVAPQAQIIAGKVLDSQGRGAFSTIVTAIYWAVNGNDNVFGTTDDFKADAINISIGGKKLYQGLCDNSDTDSQNMARAINYARDHGVVVVVSAGNDGSSGVSMPGCLGNSFTVGAVDSSDTIAGFSGRGSSVDIVAPGVNIYSTILGGNLSRKSGTSMASPMVAGLVALIKSAFPNYTVNQVEKAITDNAIDLGTPGKDNIYGQGRISATAAGTGSTPCTGTCGTLVASPASCTKGMTASNPNCNINLTYTSSGISPSILSVEKDGFKIQTPTTASGNVIDSNPTAGIYVYSLENVNTGQIISSTTVYVYYAGALTSPWLSCTKNADPANPNCDISLNYNITGNVSGNGFIYKDGIGWKSVALPSGSAIDANPSVGTHTYTIRDGNSNSETQADRVIIRIEGPSKSRIISSILPSVARVGDTITIAGTNIASPLGGGVPYCTVQIHDKNRVRHTTLGNPSGTTNNQCTWVVNMPPDMPPGNYTLRVGPDLNPNNVSNEVNLTIVP